MKQFILNQAMTVIELLAILSFCGSIAMFCVAFK